MFGSRITLTAAILCSGLSMSAHADGAAWYVVVSEVDDDEEFVVQGPQGRYRCDAMTYCTGIRVGDRVLFQKDPDLYVNDEITYRDQRCSIWDCDVLPAQPARVQVPQVEAAPTPCLDVRIKSPRPFMGNAGEILHLADGSAWVVGSEEKKNLYEYGDAAQICDGRILVVGDESLVIRRLQ